MASNETMKTFGVALDALIKRNGLTRKDFADQMGYSGAIVSEWCKGRKMPRMDKVAKIAKKFDVSVSSLIENQPSEETNEGLSNDIAELMRLSERLTADDLEELLALARIKASKRAGDTE